MRTAKDFLVQECANLRSVLEETLRLKYGLAGSKEFFEECQERLTFLTNEANAADAADSDALQKISLLLDQLSDLVSRIERSSIGEYSWPFVEELKRIAVAICTEPTVTNPQTPPQIYVLSSGGLQAYAIKPELNRPSGSSKRIHTIIFPRTLKHFVLLHSILGHEVGHAMWRCSQHQNSLKQIVKQRLFGGGIFANSVATAAWLYSSAAPARVKTQLAQLASHGVTPANFFSTYASWQAWVEEILCDFIGLLTFGPSFVAAECNLLYAMNPAGSSIGQRHPPVGCRVNYLLSAARLRGYTTAYANEPLRSAASDFWHALESKRQSDLWFNAFTDQQIDETANEIATLLGTMPPALYAQPNDADLALLLRQLKEAIPPVGYEIDTDLSVKCRSIDFRHILYGGWIASASPTGVSFAQLNRLCEHGIMQQRAIELQITP